MTEDWRLRIELREEGHARALVDRLEALEIDHDLSTAFHDRVMVSHHGAEVLAFAGNRAQAEAARKVIEALAERHGWHLESDLMRWDDAAAKFVDARERLDSRTESNTHEEIVREERASSLTHGYPEWEVKVVCPTHHDVIELAHRLTAEGIPVAHRWRYLVLGALDEDSGQQLAARVQREAPAGTVTSVEASRQAVLAQMPPNPFASFGGLGG
jgi:hypothetical protein